MENRLNGIMSRAAVAGVIAVVLTAAGCSTPHAVPVDCGTGMRPINASPAAAGPSAATAPAHAERGA